MKKIVFTTFFLCIISLSAYAVEEGLDELEGAVDKEKEGKIEFLVKPLYTYTWLFHYIDEGSLTSEFVVLGVDLGVQYRLQQNWRIISGFTYSKGNKFTYMTKTCNPEDIYESCDARTFRDVDVDLAKWSLYAGLQQNVDSYPFSFYSNVKVGYHKYIFDDRDENPLKSSLSLSSSLGFTILDSLTADVELGILSVARIDGVEYSTIYHDARRTPDRLNAFYVSAGLGYIF